ncbi:DUF4129 domain-containing protein [Myxococcaceae bacterium GXIMD 01537]
MAVSALELRPRGAVALMDSALRLCAREPGVWALTLPSGAFVIWALLNLAEAVGRGRALVLPSLLLTLAWLTRGLFQGATCHYVQEVLVGTQPPGALSSLRAALARTPSLMAATGYLFVVNGVTVGLSGGLSLFFVSSHVVGYAVTMQGKGSVLGLYGTCARMLGPARGAASGVRLLMVLVQVLALFNLHVASNFFFFLARKLVGVDLTFAERFASLDNPTWLLFLVALTFSLFEPVKAATASLLLVDGRVRQEGLDLLAGVQQLPERGTAKAGVAKASARSAALVLLCALLAGPSLARAEPASSGMGARLGELAEHCGQDAEQAREWQRTAEGLSDAERMKFQRLLRRAESLAFEDEECDAAVRQLEQGVALAEQTVARERANPNARASAARAQAILQRPEFAVAPTVEKETPVKELAPPDTSLWKRFTQWLEKTLEELFKRKDRPAPDRGGDRSAGSQAANVLAIVLIGAVLVVLGGLLIHALGGKKKRETAGLEVSTLESTALSEDPASALSKPPEGWAHAADALAARGEYREAVRCLYLALLSRLHREGAIHYDIALSNWDYLRHFKGRREWLPPFRELTSRFDFAWYGNVPVGAEGYRAFRALTEPLLRAQATPEAAGA